MSTSEIPKKQNKTEYFAGTYIGISYGDLK